MKFQITATIELTREVTGTINVTKQDVVDAGFCKAVEDGDSTAWYGYVSEFLESEFRQNGVQNIASKYDYHWVDIKIHEDYIIEDTCRSVEIDW